MKYDGSSYGFVKLELVCYLLWEFKLILRGLIYSFRNFEIHKCRRNILINLLIFSYIGTK